MTSGDMFRTTTVAQALVFYLLAAWTTYTATGGREEFKHEPPLERVAVMILCPMFFVSIAVLAPLIIAFNVTVDRINRRTGGTAGNGPR